MPVSETQAVNENNFGPPPVDFPAQAPASSSLFESAAPMPAPPVPPVSPQVKKSLGHGSGPVTQDTMIRQTFYPGGGAGSNPVGLPGTDRRASGCIQYMAKVFNGEVPDSSEFFIRVDRVGPAMWEGQRLPLGPIESRMPVTPYPDLHENIRSIHGGGEYQLRVFDAEGRQQHQMKFSVDVLQCPPNSRLPGMPGYAPAMTSGAHRSLNPLAAINQDAQDDIQKLRTEEQRLRAEQTTLLQAANLENTREDIEKNRKFRRETEERKTMGPQVEGLRLEMNATIKDLIRDNQLQQERMMHALKELVGTKPQDNGQALMMAETMKGMMAMVAAVVAGANKPAQSNELSEAIKMTQAANEKVVTMAIQSATAQAGKNDALITQLITNRLESPDSAVKQALEMRESGWQQAMQMFQMMESMRGDAEDSQVINPEGGFLGNLGNVLLSALSGMMKGGGGGNKILETIAANLGKQPNQLSQQDLRFAAQKMEQQARPQLPVLKPMQLPAPQPQPVQQQRMPPMQQRVVPGGTGLFDAIYETVEVPQAQSQPQFQMWPMPIPVEALRPTPQETFAVLQGQESTEEIVVEPVAAMQVPAQQQQQAQPQVSSGSESLDHLVGEAVQIALEDISSERRVHDWVEFAVDKWPRDFLRAIAQAPNDEERLKLIQHHCVPSLFKQFFDLVTDLNKQSRYLNFVTNLHALVEEINKEVVGV